MYILKNAWISIVRNKGRNVLIGIIILVIACASTVTLAIKNTATNLIDSYKSAYEKEATISFDRTLMMQNHDFSNKEGMEEAKESFNNIQSYTIDDVINFADSDYIDSYYYTYSVGLNGGNIEKASSDFSFGDKGNDRHGNMPGSSQSEFTLQGYSSVESMSEFINGTYTMSEITDNAWDVIFNGNYVFVNEELATLNNIELNSTITLTDDNSNSYEFVVVGIYKENSTDSNVPTDMFSNSANTIITNTSSIVSIVNANENLSGSVSPVFILNSYDDVENLQNEMYEKGLSTSFVLQTNEEEASASVSSISNVSSFSTTFLIVTLIIGVVVLLVINMINIRERKYEIGVFRTIGVSKLKLTTQFITELLIVAIISLLIGAGCGSLMAKPIGNSLLASEVEMSEQTNDKIAGNFGQKEMNNKDNKMDKIGGFVNVQAYDSIDAVVDIKVLVQLLGIGLALVLISSLTAMISIQRFSPLTILKERS